MIKNYKKDSNNNIKNNVSIIIKNSIKEVNDLFSFHLQKIFSFKYKR